MPRIALLLAALLLAVQALAAPVRTPHVEAELVAERTAVAPGEPLTVALRLKMIPEWHTYWRNPGDSGEPTRLEWRLPPGFEASDIHWPYPHRLPAGPLLNYGYEGEVLLLTRITPPRDLAADAPITIAAKAFWLVCSRERCIPEDGELSLTLPVAPNAGEEPRWAKAIAAARAALPAPPAALAGWTLAAQGEAGGVTLTVVPPADVSLRELVFFPFDQGKIEPAAPQRLARAENGYRLTLAAATQPVGEFVRLSGVIVSPDGFGRATPARAATIDVPIAGSVTPAAAAPAAARAAELGLLLALLFAFAGGLVLNLMPCVLPVLSIKVLGFAGRNDDARTRRRYGLVYAAGVLASFWLLAAALLGLRAVGNELGWGFQLQSPVAVAALALFFFALGLNLSGVFEMGVLLPDRLASWRARQPALDWFGSGVLAVVVASPCTAPLMGAALGYAIGESGWRAFAVFTALGLGMALPYVALAWFPAWLKRVPRPGPWMVRLKQALAFPLYGTVVWLAWVLGEQAGLDAVAWLLAALVVLAAAVWLAGFPRARVAAVAVALFAIATPLPGPRPGAPAAARDPGWQPFSTERVASLAAAGKPVFVDFTAAWCATCQVNKRLVLARDDVVEAFRARGVELVRADWTRRDDEITRALAALGRNGVPVYVLYKPGRAPVLLPEVLTRERLLAALDD
jgi:thiol:disulfide interchange protein/DsbC/DsbD-like thiol-disulfide interchange protein